MRFTYAIIGSGMQGTAAAYDLARFGEAEEVRLLDVDLDRAKRAATRVNTLVGRNVAKGGTVDATDVGDVARVLAGAHACLSAAPYFLNATLARAAITARVHFNDLGGNTTVVKEELALDAQARAAGVSIIPDCGVAPGMTNTLAVYGMQQFDKAKHVFMRCGGLPQNKTLPLGYKKSFSLEGLTNEYFGKAISLRNGQIVETETFEDLETFDLPEPIGRVEAFTTSGGSSTCPYTFQGELETYDYKTIRYPGHYAQLKAFKTLGFLELDALAVKGQSVVPRDLFHAVMDKQWSHPHEPDLLVLRVDVIGEKNGEQLRYRAQIIDREDPKTGFTAMERTTAFAAAIVTSLQARGATSKGAIVLEKSVPAGAFMAELARRDIVCTETMEKTARLRLASVGAR